MSFSVPDAPELSGEGQIETVRAWLRALEVQLAEAPSARAQAQGRAAGMDRLVAALFRAATGPKRGASKGLAVAATGGYGRAVLSPYSDIDLLLLIEPPEGDDAFGTRVQAVAERLLYPLWDAGLTVGHAVRTVADCVAVGQQEMTVRSAMLDMRFVTGDRALFRRARGVLSRELFGKDKEAFVRFKLTEIARRRERTGDAVYRNEPDLKDGEGGLRDAQTAVWFGKTVWGVKDVRGLAARGIVTSGQVEEWYAATEYLLAVRAQLHRAAGRKDDRLSFERQSDIADRFGHATDTEAHAVEHFMRELLIHQAAIQRFLEDVVDRLPRRYRAVERTGRRRRRRTPQGFRIQDGRLTFASFKGLDRRPVDLIRAFAASATTGARLHPKARQAIRAHLDAIGEETRSDRTAAEAFLSLFTEYDHGAAALATMNQLGVLARFVPEFEANFCRMQFDKYHVFTVDAHSIQAVKEVQSVFGGRYAEAQPLLTDLAAGVEALPIVFGTFLHDVGKGAGKGHVEAGARMVPDICGRLGMGADATELILFLELQHLLMSHVAQRRDLADPKTILDFAEQVGSVPRLRALYLMTFADIRAVGPSTWSEWKGTLLSELYLRTLGVLAGRGSTDAAEAEITRRAGANRAAALGKLAVHAPAARARAFLDRFPERYFATSLPATIVHDASLMQFPPDPMRVRARVLPRQQLTEITFYAKDRPGLFADLAGILAANHLSVRAARIHTTVDGYALDRFRVTDVDGQPVADLRVLDRVVAHTRAVLSGETTVEALRKRHARQYGRGRPGPAAGPPRIEIHPDASLDFTVVDLFAPDRPGLLADVTRVLTDAQLDIAVAIVSTKVDQAADTFYVRRLDGGKLSATETARLDAALRRTLAGKPA